MKKLYIVSKRRPGADCGSDHELLIAKFRLKLKFLHKKMQNRNKFSSVAQSGPTLCEPYPSDIPMPIASMMPSNHLIPCRPLVLPPSISPSIRVFSNESLLRIRWPKYSSLGFTIGPSTEYSGLISFRIDKLDLLAVQGTLKSLL